MSKGNPIVGLARVVVSQQEMLEKANDQIEELTKEYTELLTEKEQLEKTVFNCKRGDISMCEVEDTLRLYEERIEELIGQCNGINDDCSAKIEALEAENNARAEELNRIKEELQNTEKQKDYFSDRYTRLNEKNLALSKKLQRWEQGRQFHWQKFCPDADGRMCLPLGHRHAHPIVDGLYRYTEEHTVNFYDQVSQKSIPVKNCYGFGFVCMGIDDGKFYISPKSEPGAELIGYSIRYSDDYIMMDELPEELK